jgi:hypothetical protein
VQQRQGRPPRRCRGRDARSASRCVAGSPTLPSHKRAGTRMLRIPQRGSPATGDSVRRPEAYAVQREPVFRVCSGVGGGRSRRDRPGRRPTGRVARWRCPTCASCCAGREPVGSSTIRRSSRPVGDRSSEKQEAPEEAPPHQRRWLIALPRVSGSDGNSMQDCGYEPPRTRLSRTLVNEARGRAGVMRSRPFFTPWLGVRDQ